jgi:hypothetical protein
MRLTILIFLTFILKSQSAYAANISIDRPMHCSSIDGLEFCYQNQIRIDGKIKSGDFEKFKTVLKTFSNQKGFFDQELSDDQIKDIRGRSGSQFDESYLTVKLDSVGGDVLEAMKIGHLVEQFRLETVATSCFSACFYIFVAGVRHPSYLKTKIGVHRPYFDQKYFAELGSSEAKEKHNLMVKNTKKYLRDMNVSEQLIELVYRVSPDDMYILTDDEIEKWVGEYHPFFEDWLKSGCEHIEKPTADEEEDFSNQWTDNSFSKGYRSYLMTKIRAPFICMNELMKTEQLKLLNKN